MIIGIKSLINILFLTFILGCYCCWLVVDMLYENKIKKLIIQLQTVNNELAIRNISYNILRHRYELDFERDNIHDKDNNNLD